MKNTLTIKAGNPCTCDCLDSVNDGTNSIYAAVIVGEATNPKLQIYNGSTLNSEVPLMANTTNLVVIPTTLFTASAVIKIRYADDDLTGAYFTINFPTALTGNLMVKKSSEYVYVAQYTQHSGGGGSYTLPIASAATLGGVRVGNNLNITQDGILNATGGSSITVDTELSTTSENPVQNKVITTRLNEVFQSVSNGKSLIASAITDKGIDTDATDTFNTMATNISNIRIGIYYDSFDLGQKISEYTLLTE